MQHNNGDPAEAQQEHWQHPKMYGEQPSAPAVHAAAVFRATGAKKVLELGAGHGRDALHSDLMHRQDQEVAVKRPGIGGGSAKPLGWPSAVTTVLPACAPRKGEPMVARPGPPCGPWATVSSRAGRRPTSSTRSRIPPGLSRSATRVPRRGRRARSRRESTVTVQAIRSR
jgi:hypothetical protein